MREVLFKNLTSADSKKKDIFLREVFERNGIVSRTERRYFYFIKDVCRLEDGDEFQQWVEHQNKNAPPKKRHFHILKEHNDEFGAERLICKVAGTFYAVVGREVYTIAFLHSFKVTLIKSPVQH